MKEATTMTQEEQDRQRLRELVLEGFASAPAGVADAAYFEALRERIRSQAARRSISIP